MPNSYWYSKLQIASECPRKYQLEFLDPKPGNPTDSADLIFGTLVHNAIDAYFSGKDGAEQFRSAWNFFESIELKYGRFNWVSLDMIGYELLQRFARLHLKHFERFMPGPQQRLYSKIGKEKEYAYEGTPDFIGKYKGINSLVDFKTAKDPYKSDSIHLSTQLYGYAELARRCHDFKAEQIIYVVFVKSQSRIQTLIAKLKDDASDKMQQQIVEQIQFIEEAKVFPKNSNACLNYNRRCEYMDQCFPHIKTQEINDDTV